MHKTSSYFLQHFNPGGVFFRQYKLDWRHVSLAVQVYFVKSVLRIMTYNYSPLLPTWFRLNLLKSPIKYEGYTTMIIVALYRVYIQRKLLKIEQAQS